MKIYIALVTNEGIVLGSYGPVDRVLGVYGTKQAAIKAVREHVEEVTPAIAPMLRWEPPTGDLHPATEWSLVCFEDDDLEETFARVEEHDLEQRAGKDRRRA
jgi:hypothetical protein